MEPMAQPRVTLVDLLDRVLDRGLVINADVIISLAGVPLIGINLRAALAGMDTMVKYGVMSDWAQRTRAQAVASRKARHVVAMAAAGGPVATATEVQEHKDGQSNRD
ncbi:MAG: gas vesicle protein [Chloroflexi bacterium]|nr:gas vesicle protein [Chloroflexota bacterium]